MEPYIYVPYPKWIFHPEHGARLVQTADEHAAAGAGWHEGDQAVDAIPAPALTSKRGRPRKVAP